MLLLIVSGSLYSCSSEKFLSEGQYVLSDVKLVCDNKNIKTGDLRSNIRQEPNSQWFNLFKIPLGVYCISGTDSTKKINRFFRRIGEAPVIYDQSMEEFSRLNLENALFNQGYLKAKADVDHQTKQKKMKLTYRIQTGRLYYIDNINFKFDNDTIRQLVQQEQKHSLLYKGMPLDISILENERSRIINHLHEHGYYRITNNFITYTVDTVPNYNSVDLTLNVTIPPRVDSTNAYKVHYFGKVKVYDEINHDAPIDSLVFKNITYYYNKKLHLNKSVYNRNIHIRPDSLYSERRFQNTYGSLNSLQALKSSSIRLTPDSADPTRLNCDLYLWNNKKHSIATELEGTNTAGDLGAAASVTYTNRNIFHGSESFSLKLRGAYEAITKLEGYDNSKYIEYNIESGFQFPTFLLPFPSAEKKQSLKASSEINFQYNLQNRPEFHRRVATATWSYKWAAINNPKTQHKLDLFGLDYIFMPWISDTFRKDYLEDTDSKNSVIRYSYEDLFIMKTGYSFLYNSSRKAQMSGLYQTNAHQIKVNVEFAGNLLYGISKAAKIPQNASHQYTIFNIAYSQYAKIDFDLTKSFLFDEQNSLVFHFGFGVGIPYGNSTILPYEKRYFSGGANSVRGWSVRSLGPGSFVGKDGKVDFINQTGNVKLDLNLEYRTHLFWKLDAAAYIDAGNIWNTRNYEGIDGGQFKFDTFYKQIAVSYGVGLRLNFDYFILRFDTGMKAINPAVLSGKLHYPIICPDFKRDFAFHFAVGLPF